MSNRSNNNIGAVKGVAKFSYWKVLLPVFIGLTVVAWLFVRDAEQQNIGEVWSSIDFSMQTILCIGLAWVFMIGRDFGLSWRFRHLTDKQLSWKKAVKVCCLCEFTSCVTPSSVGGSSLGMIYLHHEGIEFGRATALMITTLMLDELFFVAACPIIMLFTPLSELFYTDGSAFSNGLQLTFWLVYAGITIWTIILFWGIVINPNIIRKLMLWVFSLPFLRRWKSNVGEFGDNIIATSKYNRSKPISWWLKAFAATALSWTSRYLVVNALFLAFVPTATPHQWIILARQLIVWVVLTISPTPGGSGISEWLFTEFYGAFIPTAGLALIIAIFWRLISYYVYLIIGCCLIPKWINETYHRLRKSKSDIDTQ